MKTRVFGKSALGLPLIAHRFQQGSPRVLILGGVHGDEVEGLAAADGLLASLLSSNPYALDLTVVPRANPDGALHGTRVNGHGVDLNRNLPTKDWSPLIKTPRYHPGLSPGGEPESQALIYLLDEIKPNFILSLHSWHPVLNVNGDCRAEADILSVWTGYRIDDDIGYPTPGCLGTYAGLERGWPTLTYEIARGSKTPEVLNVHVPAIREALKVSERRS